MPNFHSDVGENIDPKIFRYDEIKDTFHCKSGHEFKRKSSDELEASTYARRYQLSGNHCHTCPLHAQCFRTPRKSGQRKALVRNIFWELQKKTKARESRPRFRQAMSERQWKMEGIFAEGKSYHGLDRAKYRGQAKMQIQAYMTGFVQNLKRMLSMGANPFVLVSEVSIWFERIAKRIFEEPKPA